MTLAAHKAPDDFAPLVESGRISGSLYTAPEIFERELDRIWSRDWVYIGHESEVASPGDYVRRTIGRQPVVMTRDRAGDLHVLYNRCRHRANLVCHADQGNSKNLRCPYHGWTYDISGELVGVPYPEAYEPLDKNGMSLTPVARVEPYRGFVFASAAPDGISLTEKLGAARETLDRYCDLSPEGEIEVRAGVQRHLVRANWKMPAENTMDGYHVFFVHASASRLVRGRPAAAEYDDIATGGMQDLGHGSAWVYMNAKVGDRFIPDLKVGTVAREPYSSVIGQDAFDAYADALAGRVGGRDRALDILNSGVGGRPPTTYIFPNLLLIADEIRIIEPRAVDRTVLYYFPVLLKGVPGAVNDVRLRHIEYLHGPAGFVAPDDIAMMERNQEGLAAHGDDWLILSRGMHRETVLDGRVTGRRSDEVTQRGMWSHYRAVMSAGANGER
jgi:nitrite reductase/ring-hydroxylating ferredoxin subunit